MTTVLDIEIAKIHPSPTNPRKRFRHLEELARSINAHGVMMPVTVRPHPTLNHGSYELVFGERRLKASQLAGAGSIPAIVREMTDAEVREAQIVENTQRDDVAPLEEAEGYHALLEQHGYTIEMLAAKTGKSLAHLYGRLKLMSLAPGPREALTEERIGVKIAEMLARLPVAKLQEDALADILGISDRDTFDVNVERESITPGVDNPPLSHRAAQALIHRRYTLRLALAKFEPGDETLVPAVGACTACVHRSGNQPELFPDLAKPEDVCTNPPCFAGKTLAVWKRAEDHAFELGQSVVQQEEAKVFFDYRGVLHDNAPWIDPAAELPWEHRSTHGTGKMPTWEKLLGKKHQVPGVLVQDPMGAPRELLDKAAAILALTESGKIEKPTKPSAAAGSVAMKPTPTDRKERAKEKAKAELKEAAFARVLAMVADVDPPDTSKEWLPVVRWLLRTIEPLINLDAREMLGARHDKDLDKLVVDVPNLRAAFALLAEMLVAEQCDAVLRGVGKKTNFEAALTLFKVDWDKAQALAKAAADAEKKSDAAKKKPVKAGAK